MSSLPSVAASGGSPGILKRYGAFLCLSLSKNTCLLNAGKSMKTPQPRKSS